jgi:hypothetical protein
MRKALPLALLATALTCALFTAPAHAQRARTFVASYGNDANPCTFGSPCKTFQQAVNVVAAGGEVTAIDSAGFGPIAISQAITITSPDGVEAGIVPVSGGAAIIINAGPNDAVVLRGLTLNGSGAGSNGVVFNSGASLTVTNCVVQNFASDGSNITNGNGILIQPTSSQVNFTITNSIFVNNDNDGILYFPPSGSASANGVVDHVTGTGNFDGIAVISGTGGTVTAISNSNFSNNGDDGIFVSNGTGLLTMSIDTVSAVSNSVSGIAASGTPNVLLGRSVITGNGTGVDNTTSNTFFTYKDNRISGNGTDISSPLNTTVPLQ